MIDLAGTKIGMTWMRQHNTTGRYWAGALGIQIGRMALRNTQAGARFGFCQKVRQSLFGLGLP
jgi:hypothetical protein